MKRFSASAKFFFSALFVLLVFISNKVNFSALVGAKNQFFTLFQFFGPVAGGILGPFVGAVTVLIASAADLALRVVTHSSTVVEPVTLLRLLPMVFAAYYFGVRNKGSTAVSIIVPAVAILLFILHPVGRQVWYYSLFWTIPVIAKFLPERLFIRSLGTTFAAHSVGGAIWVWNVPMTPEMWTALIPVVILERLLFASGITVSFIAANTLLAKVESKVPLVSVDKRYVFSRQLLQHI